MAQSHIALSSLLLDVLASPFLRQNFSALAFLPLIFRAETCWGSCKWADAFCRRDMPFFSHHQIFKIIQHLFADRFILLNIFRMSGSLLSRVNVYQIYIYPYIYQVCNLKHLMKFIFSSIQTMNNYPRYQKCSFPNRDVNHTQLPCPIFRKKN